MLKQNFDMRFFFCESKTGVMYYRKNGGKQRNKLFFFAKRTTNTKRAWRWLGNLIEAVGGDSALEVVRRFRWWWM